MPQIVGYFPEKTTWKKVSEKEYRKKFNHDYAISYLKNEIDESINREMDCISKGNGAGFYAAVRFLFPEVTHLANLYYGNTLDNLEPFLARDYMSKFKILSPAPGLYYDVFRNGLMHSHHPKWLRKTKGSWYISNDEKLDKIFGIFTKEFTDQVKSSIENFINELEREKKAKKRNRLNKFLDTLVHCGKFITKNKLRAYAKTDFSKLKVTNQ